MSSTGLSIEFEETGEVWENVEDFNIDDDFTIDSDEWTATVFDYDDPIRLRRKFLPKSRVKLFVGGKLQLIGRIQKTADVDGSAALVVSGTDYFADLVAPGADDSVRISTGMTLADALLEGMRPYGITEVETDLDYVLERKMGKVTYQEVETDQPIVSYQASFGLYNQGLIEALKSAVVYTPITAEVNDSRPKYGEGLLAWGQDLCARYGLVIQPGSKRSAIAVVAPDFSKGPVFHFSRPEGNVVDAKATRDWNNVPTTAALRAKNLTQKLEASGLWEILSPVEKDSILAFGQIEEVQRIFANARAVEGRLKKTQAGNADDWYCPVYFRDDQARKQEELNRSSRRMLADRLRETLEYECTVSSHEDPSTGRTFCSNVLANVADNISDVNETLWIKGRSIGYSGGTYARMKMIRPASFQL